MVEQRQQQKIWVLDALFQWEWQLNEEVLNGESLRTDGSEAWHEGMGCLKDTLTCGTCMEVGLDL